MPQTTIESFQIEYLQLLDEKGNVDENLKPSLSEDDIRKMYRLLLLGREFDQRALSLQREGRLGTYASIKGQEATQVGSALALGKSDWVFPSFRESAVFITMGYPIDLLYQFWAGDERGMKGPPEINIFPVGISVSTQMPHAVGAAIAAKYKKDRIAVITYFGDGATSKGDFSESLNMAGVFKAPAVFICQNNQWAISVPRARQTASKTIAQKAIAYGFNGIQVDGNDVFAVYTATRDALEKARGGEGPTLIECYTYRLSDHTTADDASRYRPAEEVEYWKGRDPLLRLRSYIEKKNIMGPQDFDKMAAEIRAQIEEAVRMAEKAPPPDPEEMFRYTYGESEPKKSTEAKYAGS